MENTTDLEPKLQLPVERDPKRFSRKLIIFTAAAILVVLGIIAAVLETNKTDPKSNKIIVQNSPTPTPKKDEPFGIYTSPKIPKKDVYIIFMVGDSMTEALGPYGSKINESLNALYQSTPGNQRIVIDNYATGSTNLLGLQDAMKQKTKNSDNVLDPLLSRQFDVLLIESFGYNPLSQLGIDAGLKKQTQTLDALMNLLTTTHPKSAIIFVATIAPNKKTYAQEVSPDETLAEREAQAEERMEYIKNHIAYAIAHDIPLIDIYNKSLTPEGDGDLSYINPNDHIHPSFKGIDFIGKEIANFIYDNQILPR
jgi:lysophospholipase L1-like esterase